MSEANAAALWPPLEYEAWSDTCNTLHMWLQIVGKIQLMQCTWINHSWHVALQVTARGLATRLLPHGLRTFQIEFDFIHHRLHIRVVDGAALDIPLEPQTTASFYRKVMEALDALDLHVKIRTTPSELPDPIPFERDEVHRSYDSAYANRYWRVLVQSQRVFEIFRARFVGKNSPVHFFWGSADLAVTRFSGRPAPPHPGGVPNLPDWVAKEAYSQEVSSAGFWAGGEVHPHAVFYSYGYPEPAGFAQAPVSPADAYYDTTLKEFVLPYEKMQTAADPDGALLDFLQSTYEAAASLGKWDRGALESKM
jgi:hypothetical protein